jgi:hypothetical protein
MTDHSKFVVVTSAKEKASKEKEVGRGLRNVAEPTPAQLAEVCHVQRTSRASTNFLLWTLG